MRVLMMSGVAAAIALAAPIGSANAMPPQVQAGVLECQGGQNVGFIVGSVTNLNCVFQSANGRPEPYVATIRRAGVDLGFTQETRLAWAVSAPTARVGRGRLAGSYGGVGANASVGIGFGGNFLLGGPSNAYALQPISVQGQTGLNVTAGIADLQLQPAVMRSGKRAHRHHHRRHRR